MGLGLHIAGDVITTYGTMVLWPFTTWRAVLGTTFIIDPWFSGIIVAGLAASVLLRRSKLPSVAALALLVAYIGFQFVLKQKALDFGEAYASSHGLSGARIEAQPRPVSPFNWTVFVSDEEVQRLAHVNLVRKEPKPYRPGDGFVARVDAPYLPLEQAVWVRRTRYGETDQALIRDAWSSDALGFFRRFARFPAFDGMTPDSACVWFIDLSFLAPGRDWIPFQYGACRDAPGAPWRGYERTGPLTRAPLG